MPFSKTIGLGGTFDHFHDGHRHFLEFASRLGSRLIVGITDPKLSKQKLFSDTIQPLRKRKKKLAEFCDSLPVKYEIVTLTDPYGPTIDPSSRIDELVVTVETQTGAAAINDIRSKLKLNTLPVAVCDWVEAQDGKLISSTRIRKGEIDEHGLVFNQVILNTLQLNATQKMHLKHPLGKNVTIPTKQSIKPPLRIVVGDQTLQNFITNNWQFEIGIFDGQSQRKPFKNIFTQPDFQISNPAGSITTELSATLTQIISQRFSQPTTHPTVLKVVGEEDLAVLPSILLSPLYSQIYYGQPNQGMVEVTVNLAKKLQIYHLLT